MSAATRDRDIRASQAVINNPLMREEVRRSAEQAKTADTYRTISGYLNWVTTGLVGGALYLAAGAMKLVSVGIPTAWATAGFGLPVLAGIVGVASVATLIANVAISRKATHIEQYNQVLASDIDSQNQAHRMVQAFAKAQVQGQVQADNSAPMTSNWSDRVGGARSTAGSWQERIAEQADREQVQSIAAVRG